MKTTKTNKTSRKNSQRVARVRVNSKERQQFLNRISEYLNKALIATQYEPNKKAAYEALESALYLSQQIGADIRESVERIWANAVPGMIQFQALKAYYEIVATGDNALNLDAVHIRKPKSTVSPYYQVCLGKMVLAKGRKKACETFIASSRQLELKKWADKKVDELVRKVRKAEAQEKALINAQIDQLLAQAEELAGAFVCFTDDVKPLLDQAKELARTIGEDISSDIRAIALSCIGGSRKPVLAVA